WASFSGSLYSPLRGLARSHKYATGFEDCGVPVGAGEPATGPAQAQPNQRINPFPTSEMHAGGQQCSPPGRLVGEVGGVGLVVVRLVGEVLHVQLQVDVLGQFVGGHGVVTHVAVDHGGVGHAAVYVIHVERTATDSQLWRDGVGSPQAGAVVRRVWQLVAVVGFVQRAAVDLTCLQVGIAGEYLPF